MMNMRETDSEFLQNCRLDACDVQTQGLALRIRRELSNLVRGAEVCSDTQFPAVDSLEAVAFCVSLSDVVNAEVRPEHVPHPHEPVRWVVHRLLNLSKHHSPR